MPKLFQATENQTPAELAEDNPLDTGKDGLLIDKVLQYSEKAKPTTSVTADLLKQRHDLRNEITKELQEQAKKNEEGGEGGSTEDDGTGGENAGGDGGGGGESGDTPSNEEGGEGDAPKEEGSTEPETKPNEGGEESESSDDGAAADDADSLRGLVGSGNNKATESYSVQKPKAQTPVSKKVVSETMSTLKLVTSLKNIFAPLKQAHRSHCLAVESFGGKSTLKPTEQPLVYVKEEVIKSLENLIALANHYIRNTSANVEQSAAGLKTIGETLTAHREYMEAGRYQFTQKLLQDQELLETMSVENKSDVVHTSAILTRYLAKSSAAAVKLLQNPFEQLHAAFQAAGYSENEKGVLASDLILPGFIQMHASTPPFTNYIDAKYDEYQVYKLRTVKPQAMYALDAISLDDDSSYKKFLNELDKILISAGLILDNLKLVGDHFQKFTDEAKTIAFDVEKGSQTELAGLGLDDKLKDFIKYKLVTELYVNDLDSTFKYLTGAMTVLSNLVELTDN